MLYYVPIVTLFRWSTCDQMSVITYRWVPLSILLSNGPWTADITKAVHYLTSIRVYLVVYDFQIINFKVIIFYLFNFFNVSELRDIINIVSAVFNANYYLFFNQDLQCT